MDRKNPVQPHAGTRNASARTASTRMVYVYDDLAWEYKFIPRNVSHEWRSQAKSSNTFGAEGRELGIAGVPNEVRRGPAAPTDIEDSNHSCVMKTSGRSTSATPINKERYGSQDIRETAVLAFELDEVRALGVPKERRIRERGPKRAREIEDRPPGRRKRKASCNGCVPRDGSISDSRVRLLGQVAGHFPVGSDLIGMCPGCCRTRESQARTLDAREYPIASALWV
jgi:hypothetical protein